MNKNTKPSKALVKTDVMQSAILPHELRIGNLILANGKPKPLTLTMLYEGGLNEYCEYIPLDKKWLEKMGFIRDDDTSYRWFILDRSVAYDLDDNCIRISDSWEFGKRKYVHELQNLIFFLSGIELAVA
jgi:hypothetical protein